MASRTDRRISRKAIGGNQRWAEQALATEPVTAPVDAKGAPETPKGAEAPSSDVSILHLLGAIPSPVRAFPGNAQLSSVSHQPQGVPCCPPPQTPMPLVAPSSPPPPPLSHVSNFEAGSSYRERLRAGGQGAFQRAFNVGLMPKSMKEWNGQSSLPPQADMHSGMVGVADVHGMMPQQDPHNGMMMQCMSGNDPQQMWNGAGQMQGHDYWFVPMDQQQMSAPCPSAPCPYTQSVDMMPMAPMPEQQPALTMPPQAMLQPQPVMTPTSSDSTPTDIERCMSIVMPEFGQMQCDKDLMAAQLRAAAECQYYED